MHIYVCVRVWGVGGGVLCYRICFYFEYNWISISGSITAACIQLVAAFFEIPPRAERHRWAESRAPPWPLSLSGALCRALSPPETWSTGREHTTEHSLPLCLQTADFIRLYFTYQWQFNGLMIRGKATDWLHLNYGPPPRYDFLLLIGPSMYSLSLKGIWLAAVRTRGCSLFKSFHHDFMQCPSTYVIWLT